MCVAPGPSMTAIGSRRRSVGRSSRNVRPSPRDRDEIDLELVDQAGGEELLDGVGAACDQDILVARLVLRELERVLQSFVHERERCAAVPQDLLVLLVLKHNTGTCNGGSSPHGSSPVTNIMRPMITAPMLAYTSSIASASAFSSSPPSMSCRSRQAASPAIHSCSRSPSSPSGLFFPAFTPAE